MKAQPAAQPRPACSGGTQPGLRTAAGAARRPAPRARLGSSSPAPRRGRSMWQTAPAGPVAHHAADERDPRAAVLDRRADPGNAQRARHTGDPRAPGRQLAACQARRRPPGQPGPPPGACSGSGCRATTPAPGLPSPSSSVILVISCLKRGNRPRAHFADSPGPDHFPVRPITASYAGTDGPRPWPQCTLRRIPRMPGSSPRASPPEYIRTAPGAPSPSTGTAGTAGRGASPGEDSSDPGRGYRDGPAGADHAGRHLSRAGERHRRPRRDKGRRRDRRGDRIARSRRPWRQCPATGQHRASGGARTCPRAARGSTSLGRQDQPASGQRQQPRRGAGLPGCRGRARASTEPDRAEPSPGRARHRAAPHRRRRPRQSPARRPPSHSHCRDIAVARPLV